MGSFEILSNNVPELQVRRVQLHPLDQAGERVGTIEAETGNCELMQLSTIELGRRTGGVTNTMPAGFNSNRYLSTTVYENVTVGTPIPAEQIRSVIGRRI